MGNGLSPCTTNPAAGPRSSLVELVHWGGGTTELIPAGRRRRLMAEELMFRFPDRVVCRGDSFFLGHPAPTLGLADPLLPGLTYFLLPVERLPSPRDPLTAVSLAALSPAGARAGPPLASDGPSPFEYVEGGDGRVLIKVRPEFIKKIVSGGGGDGDGEGGGSTAEAKLCSTPELRKQYDQLVGAARDRAWSPALETISECKRRRRISSSSLSPMRLLGLEQKERPLNCCVLSTVINSFKLL